MTSIELTDAQIAEVSLRRLLDMARADHAIMAHADVWYPEMRDIVRDIMGTYGHLYPHMTFWDWCQWASILSARVHVQTHIRLMWALAKHGPAGVGTKDSGAPVYGLPKFIAKACRIMNGERGEDVLLPGATKTFWFARDIYGGNTHRDVVTIDTWMWKAALWTGPQNKANYATVSGLVVALALEYGLVPCVAQAAIWIALRGTAW